MTTKNIYVVRVVANTVKRIGPGALRHLHGMDAHRCPGAPQLALKPLVWDEPGSVALDFVNFADLKL